MHPIEAKRTLRSAMLAWRAGLSEEERRAAADGLLDQFQLEQPIETPCVVSGFWPMREDYRSVFLLSGPGIKPAALGPVQMISLKDRLAGAMGLACPTN